MYIAWYSPALLVVEELDVGLEERASCQDDYCNQEHGRECPGGDTGGLPGLRSRAWLGLCNHPSTQYP